MDIYRLRSVLSEQVLLPVHLACVHTCMYLIAVAIFVSTEFCEVVDTMLSSV